MKYQEFIHAKISKEQKEYDEAWKKTLTAAQESNGWIYLKRPLSKSIYIVDPNEVVKTGFNGARIIAAHSGCKIKKLEEIKNEFPLDVDVWLVTQSDYLLIKHPDQLTDQSFHPA
jgi:hypothetical protein